MLLQHIRDQLHSHAHFLTSSLEALQQCQRTSRHSSRKSHLKGCEDVVTALELGKVQVQGAAVDGDRARPRPDPDARDARFAPTGRIRAAEVVDAAHPPRRILLLQRFLYPSPLLAQLLPRVLRARQKHPPSPLI